MLYTGLVLGQNVRTGRLDSGRCAASAGERDRDQRHPAVTDVRYRAAIDVGVLSPDSFTANVDLSRVDVQPGGPPVTVPVNLIALQPGVTIVDFEPREVQVQLDPVEERQVAVTVSLGSVPDGVNVGPPQVDPTTVDDARGIFARQLDQPGRRARLDRCVGAECRSRFELVAVDANGNEVPNVQLDPERVRVRIAVARELANRTLPMVPVLVGQVAPGYRISAITVEPLVVTVSGEAAIVGRLENAPTLAISVAGRSTDLEANVGLDLPAGVSVNGSDQIKVMLTIVPVPVTPSPSPSAGAHLASAVAVTKLFGTDGIRGVANVDLHPKLAYDLGRATASRLLGAGGSLLLGQDTRRSGDMLAAAVAAGALCLGVDVHRLGVCPTPALAHLTATGSTRPA